MKKKEGNAQNNQVSRSYGYTRKRTCKRTSCVHSHLTVIAAFPFRCRDTR